MISKSHSIMINSSIEICFKTPIYCDVKEIMTGYGPLPASEGVIEDYTWANPKGCRTVLAFGKPLCTEKIILIIKSHTTFDIFPVITGQCKQQQM